jgi:uncharacterized protein
MPETYLHGVNVIEIDDGIRPIRTARSSVIGIVGTAPYADAAMFPLNTPVLLINAPRKALALVATRPVNQAASASDGSLPAALNDINSQAGAIVVVVRVAAGADEAGTLANVAGSAIAKTGVYALLNAQSLTGSTPKIIVATGWTHQQPDALANPVVSQLKGLLPRLGATSFADGPGTTDVGAVDAADDAGSDRIYLIDPWAKTRNEAGIEETRPASALAAGLLARSDEERGFWWSPSNQVLAGVVGLGRPIGFALSDPASQANWLNERNVGTIIRQNGFRLWGNRTTGADPQWAFLSVRRTADMIYQAIEASFLWAMDRPQSPQLLADVIDSVTAYLADLKAKGAILGGKAWLDPELNSPANLKAGKLYINFDIEPPAPLERLTFRASREDGYYSELVASLTGNSTINAGS